MIDPFQFALLVIRPTLQGLGLHSLAAERLLLGTALAESGLRKLKQDGGPALGLYQVEPDTHVDLYRNWLRFRPALAGKLAAFRLADQPRGSQLVWNLAYATAVARLIYYRDPAALPPAADLAGQARYWKRVYNTSAGKGTAEHYMAAVEPHWHGPAFLDDAGAPEPGSGQPSPAPGLRASTPMTLGFRVQDPPQWLDFLERHPDQAAGERVSLFHAPTFIDDLIRINREVNDHCPYRPDPAGNDNWRLLEDGEAGDCEDLALTKRARLAARGWPMGILRPGICRVPDGRGHLVLLSFLSAGVYVADNLFAHIAPWAGLPYRWELCLGSYGWQAIIDTN
jgi:predicted transglutaminase-like cysteine proteinase